MDRTQVGLWFAAALVWGYLGATYYQPRQKTPDTKQEKPHGKYSRLAAIADLARSVS